MKYLLILIFSVLLCGCGKPSILDAHNQERTKKGILILKADKNLDNIAQKHADWMVKKEKLQHQSLNKIMEEWSTGGENIACGQENVEEVMDAWMHSQGHKRNILNKNFTHAGFGKSTTKDGVVYWCVDFGG